MKLDRRGFIKLAVGAAAGIGLTPLPWKLTDDIAIWTQNWCWVPRLIRYPDLTYARTVCTLCEGGCGIKVRVANEKQTVKVEGSETAPVNQGKVCPIGAAGPQ
ncbi:MAG: molybdopterin oxidoreductase, partial [Thermodesulfobacteriota bacterium]|nr:molybdopterin oxidoreductase [Thermodesulfobacteriota bacterium]